MLKNAIHAQQEQQDVRMWGSITQGSAFQIFWSTGYSKKCMSHYNVAGVHTHTQILQFLAIRSVANFSLAPLLVQAYGDLKPQFLSGLTTSSFLWACFSLLFPEFQQELMTKFPLSIKQSNLALPLS